MTETEKLSSGEHLEQRLAKFLNRSEPPFDYERKVFESQFERLLRIREGKITPPYEVEIQPSSVCNIDCGWCVGSDFPRLRNLLARKEMIKISRDLLNFTEDGFKVETVKFSGFVGEPLVNPATVDGLEEIINGGRRTGLFTNGMLMNNSSPEGKTYLETISKASYLHVSLDAGSEKTMQFLKGPRADFNRIMRNIKQVIAEKEKRSTSLEVGVGYVVTSENFHEIYEVSKTLKDYGTNFIRFKVDITGKYKLAENSQDIATEIAKTKELDDKRFKVIFIHDLEKTIDSSSEIYDVHNLGNIKCYSSQLWGTIGSDGGLYACDHRTHRQGESWGDLRENTFRDLWISRQNNLPDKLCKMCSPFATRTNPFLTFLLGLKKEEMQELYNSYQQKKQS